MYIAMLLGYRKMTWNDGYKSPIPPKALNGANTAECAATRATAAEEGDQPQATWRSWGVAMFDYQGMVLECMATGSGVYPAGIHDSRKIPSLSVCTTGTRVLLCITAIQQATEDLY